MTDTNRPWLKGAYNGFSAEERKRLGAYATRAMKSGRLTRPTRCHVCGQTDGIIMGHQEDYRAWGDYFSMCLACHKALHERFRNPEGFSQWMDMLLAGERAPAFHTYDWSGWARMYRQPSRRWVTEPADRDPDLTLFLAVPMRYADHVPAKFDRMNGAPLLPCQHKGEVGSGVDLGYVLQ